MNFLNKARVCLLMEEFQEVLNPDIYINLQVRISSVFFISSSEKLKPQNVFNKY
jgi:hypothetical protein